MAGLLGKLGVVAVFANFVSQHLAGIDWFWASLLSLQPLYTPNISSLVVRRVLQHCSPPLRPSRGYGRTNSVYHLALWFDEQPWLYINSL